MNNLNKRPRSVKNAERVDALCKLPSWIGAFLAAKVPSEGFVVSDLDALHHLIFMTDFELSPAATLIAMWVGVRSAAMLDRGTFERLFPGIAAAQIERILSELSATKLFSFRAVPGGWAATFEMAEAT